MAIAGATILGFLLLVAILAPVVARMTRRRRSTAQRSSLGRASVGLDALGRDVLSRVMYGARTPVHRLLHRRWGPDRGDHGGRGGRLRRANRQPPHAADGHSSGFPSLLLAIGVVAIGPGADDALYAIAFVSIPVYARIARASILSIKELDYVEAARAIGAGPGRILFRVIMPNALTPLIVQATLGIGTAILEAAALSFIGLGAQAPEPEWGLMLAQHRNLVFTAPHTVFFPGLAIMPRCSASTCWAMACATRSTRGYGARVGDGEVELG